jgi:hypothetical protein
MLIFRGKRQSDEDSPCRSVDIFKKKSENPFLRDGDTAGDALTASIDTFEFVTASNEGSFLWIVAFHGA